MAVSCSRVELVKAMQHSQFRILEDFYRFHGSNRQTFCKYYHRFQQSGADGSPLPQKRGPKWKRPAHPPLHRGEGAGATTQGYQCKGINRNETCAILQPVLKYHTPAPSTVYAISRCHGLNRSSKGTQQSERLSIKTRAGELGHLDSHHLSRDLLVGARQRLYLVAMLDACTRLAWAEVTRDIKSLSAMFAALKSINFLHAEYGLRFEALFTDNGPEMASPRKTDDHPMERMLKELGIKHCYTRPYRPQTNVKVERFCRNLNEDLLEGTTFESVEELQDELQQYLIYYNTARLQHCPSPPGSPRPDSPGNFAVFVIELANTYYVSSSLSVRGSL